MQHIYRPMNNAFQELWKNIYIYIHIRIIDAFTHTLCVVLCAVKAAIAYIHMLAARGELHFNELLILVCAPVIIIDLMNIYVPCLKFRDMRRRGEIL